MVSTLLFAAVLCVPTISPLTVRAAPTDAVSRGLQEDADFRARRVEFEIRHSLAMLPEYGVFDYLAFQLLEKGTVRLIGEVRRGILKERAERAVQQVRGVETVINEIELLPPSSSDDTLRVALYRSLFRDTPLEQYAYHSMNPIHIIVRNGRVRLEGVVRSEADKTIAGMKAREVPLTFGVENNLRIEDR